MTVYGKNHYNIVISLQLIKINEKKYWSGLSCPPAADLPNPGIEPTSLTSPTLPLAPTLLQSEVWRRLFPGCDRLIQELRLDRPMSRVQSTSRCPQLQGEGFLLDLLGDSPFKVQLC